MRAVIALPYAWLVVFFLLPFAAVLVIAFGTTSRCRSADRARLQPGELQAPVHRRFYLAAWLSPAHRRHHHSAP
jgi:cbb3-type cytochrome oxidase subunit 3